MAGIIGIIALLIVLGLSLVIAQIGAVALTYTGLSSEAARFQARSAFTGTGITTSEAERIVDHPVRRRIIMLLKLSGDYAVTELKVEEGDWLAGRSLGECRFTDEGVTVLGISRPDGDYVGVPQADTEVRAGDTLILYGRDDALEELDTRRADASGDRAHEKAKADQDREVAEQKRRDEGARDGDG